MKKIFFLLLSFIAISCSKDNSIETPADQLPPITTTGANTFGVTINGKVCTPRDGSGSIAGGSGRRGVILRGDSAFTWNEFDIVNGDISVNFKMIIHMHPLATVGRIILQQSNFQDGIDSTPFPHIYFKIFDNNISNYAYYGSVANEGEINITRLDNGIVSGNFKGKFVRYDNPNEFITITDGRFDINSITLPNHPFP